MRYVKMFVVLLASISLLAACGGSSDSPSVPTFGGSESALNGTYRLVEYDSSGAIVIDVTFNGDGTGSWVNANDVADNGTITYKVASNGELRLYPAAGDVIKGQTDGNLLLIYDNDDSDDYITLGAGIRQTADTEPGYPLTNAVLDGTYRFVQAGSDGTSATTAVIDVTFDGDQDGDGTGTATVTHYYDSDSVSTTPADMPYTVAANGELTIGGDIGQVSWNGEEIVLADADSSGDGWMMGMIGLKQEPITGAGLDGDYVAGGFAVDAPQITFTPYTSELLLTADITTSTLTGTWTDSDGTSGDFPSPFDYNVDTTNGNLVLTTVNETGQVTDNGSAFITADIDTSDDDISIKFGIARYEGIFH